MGEGLLEQIMAQRNVGLENTSVEYNLSYGFDFAILNDIAQNLSKALFEQDIREWITVVDQRITRNPKHTVTIIVPDLGKRKMRKLNDKLWKYIRLMIMQSGPGHFLKEKFNYARPFGASLNPALILMRNRLFKWAIEKVASDIEKNIRIISE